MWGSWMRENGYGLVLRAWEYSESSQIVSVLLRDYGCVRMIAKGSRRLRGSFCGGLDMLMYGELVFIPRRRGLWVLTEFYLEEEFRGIRLDLGRYYAGLYILEVLGYISWEGVGMGRFYDRVLGVLGNISGGRKVCLSLLIFGIWALDFLGVFPKIDGVCVRCGGRGFCGERAYIHFGEGGVCCPGCVIGEEGEVGWYSLVSSLRIIQSLRKLEDISLVERVVIGCRNLWDMHRWVHRFLAYQVGRHFHLLSYLEMYFGERGGMGR